MNSNKTIACPLDCYDACEAVVIDGKIRGNSEHPVTKGKLCVNFASLLKEEFLTKSFYENSEITLNDSLQILKDKLNQTTPKETLFYKGSGNLGLMQSSTKSFFAKYGSVLTQGTLCDGGGSVGIEQSRGEVLNPPLEKLLEADVVIVWGRNLTVTSPHMYNLIKDKTFITVDPISTPIAKRSELHMAINPKTDHELALLLTRFAYMQDMDDKEFCEKHDCEEFFDLAKSRSVISYEATTGISLSQVNEFFEIIEDKKIAMLTGLGIQKYFEGATLMRSVESFAAFIGLHSSKHCGVWYSHNSMYGYEKQFVTKSDLKKVDISEVDFSKYELVFIQGANPVVTAPNTKRVIDGLKDSFVVYFGTTMNETAQYANLIIPSASFLQKDDIRVAYGHEFKSISKKIEDKNPNTISEYDLTNFLFDEFGYDGLKSEEEVLESYKTQQRGEFKLDFFKFVEDLDIDNLYEQKSDDEFYFITCKQKDSLNSQFNVDNYLYINPCHGFKDEDSVILSSKYGQAQFFVKVSKDIKDNCVLCYSGNRNANYVTNHKSDEESNSAMYQEVLVKVELS